MDNQIRFGVFEVRLDARELRKRGVRIKLEDLPFSVLIVLLKNAGAVVSRDELRKQVWPDGTFVDFDKSLNKAVNKIRSALEDSAATPRYVETLSRRGYRFVAPVIEREEPAARPKTLPWRQARGWRGAAAALLLLLLLTGAFRFTGVPRWPLRLHPDSPIQSLAVLPFVNLTGDSSQEYFADGLTDDLISELSRIVPLRVISYTSAMHYKGARASLPQISRELTVDVVVEGSVQRAGSLIRINVKLLRAAADRQLWSQSYEGDAAEAARLGGRVALVVAHQVGDRLAAGTEGRP